VAGWPPINGLLALQQEPQQNMLRGMLSPVTANPNMLAQATAARSNQQRNMLSGPTTGAEFAQNVGMVPGLGLLGVGGDIAQYIDKPETRGWLPYALTAAGALPFLGAMAKMAGPMPRGLLQSQAGAIAYHGSPHKFDAFDASKIGTGEGAQVYGHGLYMAENPATARTYQYVNEPSYSGTLPKSYADEALRAAGGDKQAAISSLNDRYKALAGTTKYSEGKERQYIQDALNNFDGLTQNKIGNLYKADIPDEWLPKMLDWDKPLSQQSREVQDAVNRVARDPRFALNKVTGDMRAVEFQAILRNPQAVQELSRLGVPGIRYLDQGSRGAGQGTSNYVVFPGMEKQVKILGRE